MNNKTKLIKKVLGSIVFVLILLTFIIIVAKLPRNLYFDFSLKPFDLKTNLTFKYLSSSVIEYYKELLKGSLGTTEQGVVVWKFVKLGFSKSITLLLGAISLSIVFGIIKGIFDSRKDKDRSSTLKLMTTIIGLSMPDIFVILILQSLVVWLYHNGIKILPVAGFETARHAILPTLSLAIIPTMYVARITALSIDSIYAQDYIRTAMGKGTSRFRVVYLHALRNAVVEVADSFSAVASMLISSLIIVEYFYYYPGLTLMMYNQYKAGQSEVVIGIAIVIGLIYLSIDLLFRALKYSLNPKLRRG